MALRRKESKGAKIRNRYNQVPHLTQDTNGKVTNSQLDTINESQEVSRVFEKIYTGVFSHNMKDAFNVLLNSN